MSADRQLNKYSAGGNLFVYCCSNAIILIDPNGTCPYEGTAADFHRLEQGLPSLHCTCIDLTEKLDTFMEKNAKTIKAYKYIGGNTMASIYFYNSVKNGGVWDIKLQEDWKFEEGKKYLYRSNELRYDDPGNINYGYVGAVLFPEDVLCLFAGLNQIRNHKFKYGSIRTFYGDPRDNAMIKYGYGLYMEAHL